jgi:hypothetical protein
MSQLILKIALIGDNATHGQEKTQIGDHARDRLADSPRDSL